jgi:hypothetical protein
MSVLPEFEAWMAGAGIQLTDAIKLVNLAPGCSGLALGVQASRPAAACRQCRLPPPPLLWLCCCTVCRPNPDSRAMPLQCLSSPFQSPHSTPKHPTHRPRLQAARTIGEGEQLCTIPKAACLSIRTTELADVIETEQLGGGLGLVLAVLHEMSLGEASKW